MIYGDVDDLKLWLRLKKSLTRVQLQPRGPTKPLPTSPIKPVNMYPFGEGDPVECLVYFAQIHETFRKAELDSLAELHGINVEWEDYSDNV